MWCKGPRLRTVHRGEYIWSILSLHKHYFSEEKQQGEGRCKWQQQGEGWRKWKGQHKWHQQELDGQRPKAIRPADYCTLLETLQFILHS